MAKKKAKSPLKPFLDHGLEFIGESGYSQQADCPFCGKERAFHVTPETTKWICSSSPERCGRSGNLSSFLTQWAEFCHENTTREQWKELSRHRGNLPVAAFRRWGLGVSPLTGHWLIPTRSTRGTVQDLRRWRPKAKRILGTTGVRTGLWGVEQLVDSRKKDWPVYICEGEWDGMALAWLFRKIRYKAIVVAVPGARGFKDDWIVALKGRKVIWCYDNDADGDVYSLKSSKRLIKHAKEQLFLCWPEGLPDKYDVRDYVCERILQDRVSPATAFRDFRKLVKKDHRRSSEEEREEIKVAERRERPDFNASLEETLSIYRDWLRMTPDLELALKSLFAVVLSTQMPGPPVWMFLVGPPGSGKTELLLSLSSNPDCFYQSSLGPKQLVSGFKQGKLEEDPSLIPKMIGKCAVFKDWTEVLESNPFDLQDLYKVLRGAYDGIVQRSFGNGVTREYEGRFTMLAGTTNKIHGTSKATVGERFLKIQLIPPPLQEKLDLYRVIIYGSDREEDRVHATKDAALSFLDRDMPACDPGKMLPDNYVLRLAALSEIVCMLRHEVEWERDMGERNLRFRPEIEMGSRLSIQLSKFAMAMAVVEGKKSVDEAIYRIVERVAFDTAIGFNLDIVEAMMELGGEEVEARELSDQADLSLSATRRRLADLRLLGIALPSRNASESAVGRPPSIWRLSRNVRKLWDIARPYESHLESAIAGRLTSDVDH